MKHPAFPYVWPGWTGLWDFVISKRPAFIVANPMNGPGGAWSPEWESIRRRCRSESIPFVGYVHLLWGYRPRAEVLGDIDRWDAWYHADGIMFDEAPLSYLSGTKGYHARARALKPDNSGLSVWNPGRSDVGLRADMLARPTSIWCSWEGSAGDYLAQRPKATFLPDRQLHLVYACGQELAEGLDKVAQESGVGYFYATSGVLPNPWETVGFLPSAA